MFGNWCKYVSMVSSPISVGMLRIRFVSIPLTESDLELQSMLGFMEQRMTRRVRCVACVGNDVIRL